VSLAVAADQREVTAVLKHCETGVRRSKDCDIPARSSPEDAGHIANAHRSG
jgi:hypothetical protein